MNIEKLKEEIYEMSNSLLPLSDFLNDIEINKDPNFDKQSAYDGLEKIMRFIKHIENKKRDLEMIIDLILSSTDEVTIYTCEEKDCYAAVDLEQKLNCGGITIPLKNKFCYELFNRILKKAGRDYAT